MAKKPYTQKTEYSIKTEVPDINTIPSSFKIWASKKEVKNKRVFAEGFSLIIPLPLKSVPELKFVVLGISKDKKESDMYNLDLHAHSDPLSYSEKIDSASLISKDLECSIDAGGDISATLKVDRKLLLKWTGLLSHDLDYGINKVNLGSTYNILLTLPRLIVLTTKSVTICKNKTTPIDSLNVCGKLFKGDYPLD
jgi:hypothetical protein